MRACELKSGQTARIIIVHTSGRADERERRRLLELGFVPGTELSLVGTAPMGDPIELSIRDYSIAMRREVAGLIEVEII